jgi:hypothetical protein
MQERITSVLDLGHYKVGDSAWWLKFRAKQPMPMIEEKDDWMIEGNAHSKTLWEGPFKNNWSTRVKLPKLQDLDFADIVSLLTSKLVIEPFAVCDLVRSTDTGEFYYGNEDDEWMPETYLFDTTTAAKRERTRIRNMLKKWSNSI